MVKLRAIDGEELYERIYHYTFEQSQTPKFAEICDFLAGMEKAADMIGDMPELNVIQCGIWDKGKCSLCGASAATDCRGDFLSEEEQSFCYSCGAKMG